MTLHLKKLCVGVDSIAELQAWRKKHARRKGLDAPNVHVTRHAPRRAGEILDGGSLYWVIAGRMACRQEILELRPVTRGGAASCAIVMAPKLIEVRARDHRPFQGWRYLEGADAPKDLKPGETREADLPPEMARELRELGLL
ncbi:MAG: DUF1489 family protein [Rhodospirillales bacterium]